MTELNELQLRAIGKQYGLSGKRLNNFVKYVTVRGFIRDDYYVREWAQRFADGREFALSDGEGRKILTEIDNDKLMKKYLQKHKRGWY